MIKIKDFSELDGVKNEEFKLSANECNEITAIEIDRIGGLWLNTISTDRYSKTQLLGILKAIGFDIEFIKQPTVTQNDYNWLVALNIPETYTIINSNEVIRINGNKVMYTENILKGIELHKTYLVSELLKLKVRRSDMNKCYICKQEKPNREMLECRKPGNVGNIEVASYDFICKGCYLKANPSEAKNPCESCKEYDGEYGHCFVDIEKDSLPEGCPLKNEEE